MYKLIIAGMLLVFAPQGFAEAGRVVFAYGVVTAESPDGDVRRLDKRSQVEAGDLIRTAGSSLVQLRMIDKAFISLRPNSEFKIEQYSLGSDKEEDSGIFSLIKGGFRAVTGIIGKRLKSAYKMRTVNATIGIRGTDYTARICNQDCNQAFGNLTSGQNIADGLYVGVNDGAVSLTNQLGSLDLDQLQFGYVKDATTAPVALSTAPEFLYFNSRPPNPEDDQLARSDSDETVQQTQTRNEVTLAARADIEPQRSDVTSDDTMRQDVQVDKVEVSQTEIEDNTDFEIIAETEGGNAVDLTEGEVESARMVAIAHGVSGQGANIAAVNPNAFSSLTLVNRDLRGFEAQSIASGVGNYARDTATTVDLGFDPVTGIAWGRWNAGNVRFQNSSGNANLDFSNTSLHWVVGPDQPRDVALPSIGTASYTLVGNTSPTDNLGNVGILGTADLSANFTARTVDTSVQLGINNQVWNGSGTNIPIGANGAFSGAMGVTVDDTSVGSTGRAAGFFTNNGDGAGMGYSLQNGATSVSGTAIFQKN